MSSLEDAATVTNQYAEREEFLKRAFLAVCFNGIEGDYAEFGCCAGGTFALAYQSFKSACERLRPSLTYLQEDRRFWAFDSFSGLPPAKVPEDEHPYWIAGAFKTELEEFHRICAQNKIPRSAYEVVAGFYDETLAVNPNGINLPQSIALAYLDCDLYSSHVAVLQFLLPRLKHGMILAFDDYFAWSANQVSGARRACVEIFASHPEWRLVPFLQFGWHGMSYVVESKKILDLAGITASERSALESIR